MIWQRFKRHKVAVGGGLVIVVFFLVAVLAPWIAPYPPDKIDLVNRFGHPSPQHWLGTDDLGRDTLSRLLYAARISLLAAVAATILSAIIGTAVGALAGYNRGITESILMRFTDLMLTLPALPLLLIFSKMLRDLPALQQLLGQSLSVVVIIGCLTIFGWMTVARLVYGSILSLQGREYNLAARDLGSSVREIIFRHLLPNSMAPIIVAVTLGLGARIVAEASLSFLGLGIMPPNASWGNMLTGAQTYIWRNPFLAFYPGLCIFVVVLAVNFVGDALRDALDPQLRL
ncbi:MAG: ABC transporter permease [Acidobacteria bacterium]|nr:ABC transporter permease [Acidobacteriota bacterium]